ncbi:MAG: hypothetical protein ISS79_02980 [Phycisphaerae bacterium]|nr:hypothetical protein [Phycisphaerae bacterium]
MVDKLGKIAGVGDGGPEIRNPNIEIRNNIEIEMTQIQNRLPSQEGVGGDTYGTSLGLDYHDWTLQLSVSY